MKASLLLVNGRVYTMDADHPRAQAVAVAGKHILAVGEDAELGPLLGKDGQVVDLAGRAVIPGLIDAHVHFGGYSVANHQGQVDVDNVPSKTEAVARVAEQVRGKPPGKWILGGGWNKNIWPDESFPTAADLDAVAPDYPVALEDKSHHATWVNSRALELAGINTTTADPSGGQILRNPSGQPTGLLLETAAELVDNVIPDPDLDTYVEALRLGIAEAQSLGLTGLHDPGHPMVLAALQVLQARGELGLRALVHIPTVGLDAAVELGLRSGLGDETLRIGGLKIFADGALGLQSAHMLAPYEGSTSNLGIPTHGADGLLDLVRRARDAGLSATIHAIGDGANRAALDAIEGARHLSKAAYGPALPDRIEHVQLLHADDLPRLARLGVVASMQPIHATSDLEMAEQHWGGRCELAYAWQSVLASGAHLAFGSDCPIETLDPLPGIHAAVSRRRADGRPGPKGWIPSQRLRVTEAVYAYTMGSAYASGEVHLKGSLTPGKLADMVVLSQDIFCSEPMEILEICAEMTIFDGRVVHRSDG
jgi:predicted amidohydrolase YtcJ